MRDVPPADGTFVWVESGAAFLDPNKISETAGNSIAMQMFEPLLNYAIGNGEPEPGVAERFEVSEDGLTYTFHLRSNALWSNGRAVTAHDFVYSWQRGLRPETASRNAQQLWYIANAKAFNEGSLTDFGKVGVKAAGDTTLVVTLEAPTSFFRHLVCSVAYAPVPKEAIEAHGDQWTRPENIVVNGPYTMTEWKLRDRVVLEKNPRYWDAASVRIERAMVLHSESEQNALQLYEADKAHWLPGNMPAEKIPLFLSEGRSDFHVDPVMCVYYYVLRMDRPPFDKKEVRHAINRAIDKERIVKHITRGGQKVATRLVPQMFEALIGYTGPEGEEFDPDAARALLSEAGYPQGQGLPKIDIFYNTLDGNRLIAESVQRNLKDTLGVEIGLDNMEWKSLLKKLQAGDFQMARSGWCADYPDPLTFLGVFHSKGENNYPAYDNPEYDALLDAIARETDRDARNALIGKAEALLNDDLPFIPFYFYTRSYLLKTFVKGFEPQYQDHHLLKYMYFEE
jgi:oligopeptide transport system substrate-binding protein